MNEVWKMICKHPDYAVSNLGRVRRRTDSKRSYKRGFILKPIKNAYGYSTVVLDRKTYRIHRLVAEAFIGLLPFHHVTHHVNENKSDNRRVNLRYVTFSENSECNRGEGNSSAKLTADDVRTIRAEYERGVSQRELARRYSVNYYHIHAIIKRRKWAHV